MENNNRLLFLFSDIDLFRLKRTIMPIVVSIANDVMVGVNLSDLM